MSEKEKSMLISPPASDEKKHIVFIIRLIMNIHSCKNIKGKEQSGYWIVFHGFYGKH